MVQRARRRPFRRRSHRRQWLEAIREMDPQLADELEELRRYHSHAFRKRILKLAWELDLRPRPPRQPAKKVAGVDPDAPADGFDHEVRARPEPAPDPIPAPGDLVSDESDP